MEGPKGKRARANWVLPLIVVIILVIAGGGVYTALQLLGPRGGLSVEIDPASVELTLPETKTISAKLLDSGGHEVTGADFQWTYSNTLGFLDTIQGPSVTFTPTKVGSGEISVNLTYKGESRVKVAALIVREGLGIAVIGVPSKGLAGTSFNITLKVLKADGSVWDNYKGKVQVTSSDPKANLPGIIDFRGRRGLATAPVTINTFGKHTVTANDLANPTVSGQGNGRFLLAPIGSFRFWVNNDTFAVTANASSSYNPDGAGIASYSWDFGDAGVATGINVTHLYDFPGSYDIRLRVTDDDDVSSTTTRPATIAAQPGAPYAFFTMTRDLMNVTVDASGSGGGSGATYVWSWGDATKSSGKTQSHVYSNPGLYTVRLGLSDDSGRRNSTARPVTVAHQTVDATMYDFFNVPYPDYWYDRNQKYGDIIVNDHYPYVDYYPWVQRQDAFLYTNYRMHTVATNISQMTADRPLIFPLCKNLQLDPSISSNKPIWACPTGRPAGGDIKMDLTLGYVTQARANQLNTICKCRMLALSNLDGFISELQGTIEMDYDTSQWVFGVTGEPNAWWFSPQAGNSLEATDPRNLTDGPVEDAWATYYLRQGLGPLDIYNAFEYTYTVWSTQLNPTVIPDATAPGGSRLRITMDIITWGMEVLFSRWFYWGDGCYPESRCWVKELDGTIVYTGEVRGPNGWWQQELGWFENFHLRGSLADRGNFTIDTALAYQFRAWAEPGADGKYATADDVLVWNWEPANMDYVPANNAGSGVDPLSELSSWSGKKYIHATPGSILYGVLYQYDYAPVRYDLEAGETLTLQFPKEPVPFYDWRSEWNTSVTGTKPCASRADYCGLKIINDTMEYLPQYAAAPNPGTWDSASKVLSFVGPVVHGSDPYPASGLPRVELGRGSLVGQALSPLVASGRDAAEDLGTLTTVAASPGGSGSPARGAQPDVLGLGIFLLAIGSVAVLPSFLRRRRLKLLPNPGRGLRLVRAPRSSRGIRSLLKAVSLEVS